MNVERDDDQDQCHERGDEHPPAPRESVGDDRHCGKGEVRDDVHVVAAAHRHRALLQEIGPAEPGLDREEQRAGEHRARNDRISAPPDSGAPEHDHHRRQEQDDEHDPRAARARQRLVRAGDEEPREVHGLREGMQLRRTADPGVVTPDGDEPHREHDRRRERVEQRHLPAALIAIATPTTNTIATATPEHNSAVKPAASPSQSRRLRGPSWSASISWINPKGTAKPTNVMLVIRSATFGCASPKNTSSVAAADRDPRADPRAQHHHQQQAGADQAEDDRHELVGRVAQAEHRPQRAVHENGNRLPVPVVRADQVAQVARLALHEVVPVVVLEPHAATDPHEERDQEDEERAVRDDDPLERAARGEERPARRARPRTPRRVSAAEWRGYTSLRRSTRCRTRQCRRCSHWSRPRSGS